MYKKAISPVVAVALLLVVAVTAIVGFQTWFNQYSSSLFTDVEQSGSGDDIAQGINNFQNGNIYFNHPSGDNVTVTEVKVGNVTCSKNITLKQGINKIRGCIGEYSDLKDVVVYTNKGVYENKVFEKSLDIPFICESNNQSNGFYGGDGSQTSPYEICNCNQLQNISNNLDNNFKLVDNIDCSNTQSWNSGSGFNPIASSFTNTFDGNGKTISNLYISRSGTDEVGLFSRGIGATVKDLTLDNFNITGFRRVSGLFGETNSGDFENVVLKNSWINGSNGVGGLVGDGKGVFVNAKVDNTKLKGRNLGGIIGIGGGQFNSSVVANSIMSGSSDLGGFVGEGTKDSINLVNSESRNNNITVSTRNAGGVVGFLEVDLSGGISKNNHIHSQSQSAGGFVGTFVNYGTLKNITNAKVINSNISTATRNAGGFIASLSDNENIYHINIDGVNVTAGDNNAGGFSGSTSGDTYAENVTVKNSYIYGDDEKVGGIIGILQGTLNNSLSKANRVEGRANNNGGVAGLVDNGVLYNSTVLNSEMFWRASSSAGIVGKADSVSILNYLRIKNSNVSQVDFIGPYDIGGIVGSLSDSSMNNSYAENVIINISGSRHGGIIGVIRNGNLSNSYVRDTSVKADGDVGGVAGANYNGGIITNSYWNNETVQFTGSDTTDSGEGTPEPTNDLQNPQSATGIYANWSSTTWDFGTSSEYPVFTWE